MPSWTSCLFNFQRATISCRTFRFLLSKTSHTATTTTLDSSLTRSRSGRRFIRSATGLKEMDKTRRFIVNFQSSDDEDEKISLSFTFAGKSSQMSRQKSEPLSSALDRIRGNVIKHAEKLSKKKGKFAALDTDVRAEISESLTDQFAVTLKTHEGLEVRSDLCSIDGWKDGHVIIFGETEFTVEVNPPTITSISLPDVIMVGFTVYPRIHSEFVDLTKCEIYWRKHFEIETAGVSDATAGVPIHTGFTYKPNISDINSRLTVTVRPSDGSKFGGQVKAVSPNTVEAGPGKLPFELRHEFTSEVTGPGVLRVLSYNILANMYAVSEGAGEHFFPHCPTNYLQIDYRKLLFTKELIGYNADVLALQEVDQDVFDHDLRPCLKDMGFEGVFSNKGSTLREGEALFFRESKLRLVSRHDVVLKDYLLGSDQGLGGFGDFLRNDESLFDQMTKRQTIVQVVILERVDDATRSKLCVANTHLYFHPQFPHIRLSQLAIITKHLESTIASQNPSPTDPVPLIFCGDFNSTPDSGGYEYLSRGRLPRSHPDWTRHREPGCTGTDLNHGFPLVNACGIPEFTNLIPAFRGVLDYIFVDRNVFSVNHVVPMPSYVDIEPYIALPNAVFPSDHIALVCDVIWNK